MLLCDTRGKAVGFYVRSSLHSYETSMGVYFAELPYMSVYFLVVYCVMHNFLALNFFLNICSCCFSLISLLFFYIFLFRNN